MASEGLNKVMLIGNLGMDPEIRFGQSGNAVLRMRLATTERYMTRGGERQERTEWHTVIFFGNRAEGLSKVLSKGETVYIEGRLQTRQWDDKDGNKRYTTEIVGTQLLFLGGRRGEGGGGGGEYGGGGGGGGYGGSGGGGGGS
ncbi:MAG TPA: single-stranded DNA-binding protein, partial [Myxococcales bacterium]|nr:single-stranded DNA-binding protein [Myxococcales bacterium]